MQRQEMGGERVVKKERRETRGMKQQEMRRGG